MPKLVCGTRFFAGDQYQTAAVSDPLHSSYSASPFMVSKRFFLSAFNRYPDYCGREAADNSPSSTSDSFAVGRPRNVLEPIVYAPARANLSRLAATVYVGNHYAGFPGFCIKAKKRKLFSVRRE